MKNTFSAAIAIILCYTLSSLAASTNEQKEIEKMLIAPCCWTATIDVHPSEISDQMKAEIVQFLKQGKTKDEILKYYVAKYGERVLAIPQSPFQKYSVYLLPAAALLLGIIIIMIFLRHTKEPASQDSHTDKNDKWLKKAESELAHWDR